MDVEESLGHTQVNKEDMLNNVSHMPGSEHVLGKYLFNIWISEQM